MKTWLRTHAIHATKSETVALSENRNVGLHSRKRHPQKDAERDDTTFSQSDLVLSADARLHTMLREISTVTRREISYTRTLSCPRRATISAHRRLASKSLVRHSQSWEVFKTSSCE